jgi:hypothetical protein
MNIYRLDYIKFEDEVNNEIYFLGYFSTYEYALAGIETYSKMPGFVNSPNNFEIKEYYLDSLEEKDVVYDVQVYFHNKDYSIEYFHCLGLYGDREQASRKLIRYEELNKDRIIENSIIYESFVNKHTINTHDLSEGFDADQQN